MKAERYTIRDNKVVAVETAELQEGDDAVFVVRSNLDRPQMHSALGTLLNDAFTRTWPPTAADGGDKAHLQR
jgi:hypothetical protein